MEKTYNPKEIESTCYQQWEQENYFAPKDGENSAYSIVIPPPNVTGTLHMGHGFQSTIMDALIRYQRMQGKATLWQMGSDHAGIATQMVVERQLLAENSSRAALGRAKFTQRVWDWKKTSGDQISQQLRRMGCSLDWSRERFTMDDDYAKTVRNVFVQLFKDGLIYRGKRLVNWDPKLNTAVSDLEVISTPEKGHLWHIRYPIANSDETLVIATTRPETLLGDTAVAVHPEDPRYQQLIGKMIDLPLTGRQIPIIADDYVNQEFGSGCVKITPGHDFNDYEMGLRHDLPQITILNKDATLNENTPSDYQGLDRFEARKQIIADLKQLNLLVKIEDHELNVPRGDRSGEIIEPLLTDQWYVNAKALAEPAIDAVKQGKVRLIPGNWDKTYFQWMENIQDWCISRQLWWGHRIPAWYDQSGNIYVGEDEATVRRENALADSIILHQEEDVLDTWFSASLWPFVTLGWPNDQATLEQFFPTNVLVTGFDIIFFWVARMIMMSLKLTGKVPFREVYITGLIRDAEGHKMSKSKGNVLDPIDLIDGINLEDLVEKRCSAMMQPAMRDQIAKATRKQFPEGLSAYGTDALRFTYCALASTGRDIRFDMGRIEGYRNFCNKLWNAARYVLMNTEEYVPPSSEDKLEPSQSISLCDKARAPLSRAVHTECMSGEISAATKSQSERRRVYTVADHWITSRLQHTITDVKKYFANYRFDLLVQTLYEFTWNEYCDWYLELSKPVLNNPHSSEALKQGTRQTLLAVLETLLRLIHPIMPYLTETIWQTVAEKAGLKTSASIMIAAYPMVDETKINSQAEEDIEWLKKVIVAIRNIRGEMAISPNKTLTVFFCKGTTGDQKLLERHHNFLASLAKCDSINWLDEKAEKPLSATGLVGDMEILIPMKGLIDKDAELARIDKAIEKIQKEITKAANKLNNPNYVAKAPAEIVEKQRQQLADNEATAKKLGEQREQIINL